MGAFLTQIYTLRLHFFIIKVNPYNFELNQFQTFHLQFSLSILQHKCFLSQNSDKDQDPSLQSLDKNKDFLSIKYRSSVYKKLQKKSANRMACSKYQYVKKFEEVNSALLQSYIVVRIDGRAFTKFCQINNFEKPNDIRAIKLMNKAAEYVCENFKDIFLAYGESDEYSFAFTKNTTLFSRRTDKILSCIVSAFSSAYVFFWAQFFDSQLKEIPMFDSRIVVYPNEKCIKDYFRWRQVDCHINNLYNTVFWCMVKSGKSNTEVQNFLKDTNSGQKNEILFQQFNINYNKLDDIYRRGTFICYRFFDSQKLMKNQASVKQDSFEGNTKQKNESRNKQKQEQEGKTLESKKYSKPKPKKKLVQIHEDCIKQQFWEQIKL